MTTEGDNMGYTEKSENYYKLRFKALANDENNLDIVVFKNELFTAFAEGIEPNKLLGFINESFTSEEVRKDLAVQLELLKDWRENDDRRRCEKSY